MIYFRPATKEDFENFKVEYDYGRYLEKDITDLIEQDNVRKAAKLFRERTGMGIKIALGYCEQYHKYVLAKRDFENGKPVFVPY